MSVTRCLIEGRLDLMVNRRLVLPRLAFLFFRLDVEPMLSVFHVMGALNQDRGEDNLSAAMKRKEEGDAIKRR